MVILLQLKSRMTAKNLCAGQGIPICVYSKMFDVGIDHLDLKSVHSLLSSDQLRAALLIGRNAVT